MVETGRDDSHLYRFSNPPSPIYGSQSLASALWTDGLRLRGVNRHHRRVVKYCCMVT